MFQGKIFIYNKWTNALTFLCGVTYDDLSASFACLLHRQRRTEALLVLPQALAFFEAILLHDLMGHRTTEGPLKKKTNKQLMILSSGICETTEAVTKLQSSISDKHVQKNYNTFVLSKCTLQQMYSLSTQMC